MSSTGRNVAGAERHADDYYATPTWVTRAILPHIDIGVCPADPAAGAGAILSELRGNGTHGAWGIELDPERASDCVAGGFACCARDALSEMPWQRPIDALAPSGIIMNPPFKLALKFVERALKETTGEVVALLRLAFLESAERARFHAAHPADVFVLARRPSFVEHLKWRELRCPLFVEREATTHRAPRASHCDLEVGHAAPCRTLGTDSAAYAWFVWRRCCPGAERRTEPGRIHVLACDGASS